MRLALFGGAFNPIHKAHTGLAKNIISKNIADKIIFMPTFISPHKETTKSVSYKDRMEMCSIAIKDNPDFVLSDLESKIQGNSYSYITLSMLKEIYPKDKLYLIVGADMYMSILSWKNPEKIFSIADIITCPRDGEDYNSLLEYSKKLEEYNCVTKILKEPIMELSSTSIRNNLEENYLKGYIDKNVYQYIKQHKLYEVT